MPLIPLVTLLLSIAPAVISPSEAADYKVVVKLGSKAFTPQEMKIKLGDKVIWMNESEEEHFLTSAGPLSKQMVRGTEELEIHKLLKPREGYTHSFAKADTYYYFCAIHLQMWGIVIVEE
jgi:plastocyanin